MLLFSAWTHDGRGCRWKFSLAWWKTRRTDFRLSWSQFPTAMRCWPAKLGWILNITLSYGVFAKPSRSISILTFSISPVAGSNEVLLPRKNVRLRQDVDEVVSCERRGAVHIPPRTKKNVLTKTQQTIHKKRDVSDSLTQS